MNKSVNEIIESIGNGAFTTSAYDMAWLARLGDVDHDITNFALNWLRENQLEDGSWGAPRTLYYHDRLVCTLAAVIALAETGEDAEQINHGLTALNAMQDKLLEDEAGETAGFELIVPALLAEGVKIGLISNLKTDQLLAIRERKLSRAPGKAISKWTTMAYSAEMAGDNVHILNVDQLQEANGSVGFSPAATAYFVRSIKADSMAIQYLRDVYKSTPSSYPTDIFEIGWVLWNLELAGLITDECEQYLDILQSEWDERVGIGFGTGYTPKDGDDTALIYEVLTRNGRSVGIDAVLSFEEPTHFRTFALESNTSVSTNIHFMGALKAAGYQASHPSIRKISTFIREHRYSDYWLDKWHVSPFYTTCHLAIVAAGYDDELIAGVLDWILESQRENGSWGWYDGTAEETAYCLQALATMRHAGYVVPSSTLRSGWSWLYNNQEGPFPMLWISKTLFGTPPVIRSAIASALELVVQVDMDIRHTNMLNMVYREISEVRFVVPGI